MCLESCFNALVENGLENTSIQLLSKYCGFKTNQALYHYFGSKEQIVTESVDYCLKEIETAFMRKAPANRNDVKRYLDTFPKWAAEKYSDSFRLAFQVYTSPKYRQEGFDYFREVPKRYDMYAHEVASNLKIDFEVIQPLLYNYITVILHYVLFLDDMYLKVEIDFLYQTLLDIFEMHKIPENN